MGPLLAEVCRANHVPGAVLGVLRGGDVSVDCHGVTSRATGVEVTPDTVFQWGSITKVLTATLVMQQVDEGALDLDAPVRTWLPDFRVADPVATAGTTLRHLLTHTSGIAGDHFHDTGRGDDCLARYVESCADVGQDVPFGSAMSYCNTGFSIIGRVLEVVTGRTWDRLLARRLLRPLGMATTGTMAEQAILHRAAVGHLGMPGEDAPPVALWQLPRSGGPAGIVHGSAGDLLTFARLHLDGGRDLLSRGSTAAMATPQVEVPDRWALGDHWGLGWILYGDGGTGDGGGVAAGDEGPGGEGAGGEGPGDPGAGDPGAGDDPAAGYGHGGTTLGQYAFLRVFPALDLAVCLLTNGGTAGAVWRTILDELVDLPPPPAPPAEPLDLDLAAYEGRYERLCVTADVRVEGDGLVATVERRGALALASPPEARRVDMSLTAVDDRLFLADSVATAEPVPFVFFDPDPAQGGRFRRFHHGGRAHSRPEP